MTAHDDLDATSTAAGAPAKATSARRSSLSPRGGAETNTATAAVALGIDVDLRDKYQAQFYGLSALRRHYERLVFELKQDGNSTSLTELFNAVLLHGPQDAEQAQRLIEALRRHGT